MFVVALAAWMPGSSPAGSALLRRDERERALSARMGSAPSPPPAVDLRFPNRPKTDDPTSKYGFDPRENSEPVTGDAAWASSQATGSVALLDNLSQLQGALDASKVVVLKFIRGDCAACASTKEKYREAARTYQDRALFFEVDYDKSKAFCKQCKLRFVPSTHVYVENTLMAKLPCGQNAWDAFAAKVEELVTGL